MGEEGPLSTLSIPSPPFCPPPKIVVNSLRPVREVNLSIYRSISIPSSSLILTNLEDLSPGRLSESGCRLNVIRLVGASHEAAVEEHLQDGSNDVGQGESVHIASDLVGLDVFVQVIQGHFLQGIWFLRELPDVRVLSLLTHSDLLLGQGDRGHDQTAHQQGGEAPTGCTFGQHF